MTGDFGPPQQGPEPEKLTPETGKPEVGKPDSGKPDAEPAGVDPKEKKGRLSRLRGRTPMTVAAAIVAVGAIAATSWGLASHGGGEQAAPDADDSGVTFGPNAPSESTSLPTLPTTPSIPTIPTLPTFPTEIPTFPTYPSAPLPTYTYPTFTYPSTTIPPPTFPTTPTTTLPTTPTPTAPGGFVYPQSPIETKITKCGTHGSLEIVKTTGVRYDLVQGDGLKGRWVVKAEARPRYELGTGATTTFSGNLGRYFRCPVKLGLRDVVMTHTGELATDPWRVKVKPTVPKKEKRALSVTYSFATGVDVDEYAGEGWTCVGPEEAGSEVTCSFGGDGQPPAVSLTVVATDDEGAAVPPSGTVTLMAGEKAVATVGFDGAASP
jgi:hypothetical protein